MIYPNPYSTYLRRTVYRDIHGLGFRVQIVENQVDRSMEREMETWGLGFRVAGKPEVLPTSSCRSEVAQTRTVQGM